MIHKDEERNTKKKACDIKGRVPNFKGLMVIFSREQGQVKSYITLKTTFGEYEYAKEIKVKYLVIDAPPLTI